MTKTCPICGKVFETTYGKKRYCSRECAAQGRRETSKRYKAMKEAEEGIEHKPIEPIQCANCGKTFMPRAHNAKYCSRECAEIKRRERSSKFYWEKTRPKVMSGKQVKKLPSKFNQPFKKKKKRLETPEQKVERYKRKAEAREWLEAYRSSSKEQGDLMLAERLGMSLEAWKKLTHDERYQKREEVLIRVRWDAK